MVEANEKRVPTHLGHPLKFPHPSDANVTKTSKANARKLRRYIPKNLMVEAHEKRVPTHLGHPLKFPDPSDEDVSTSS